MALPLLSLVIAAGTALLAGLACNEEENKTTPMEQEPLPPTPEPGDNFKSNCEALFKKMEPNNKSYCVKLWENKGLSDQEKTQRDQILEYLEFKCYHNPKADYVTNMECPTKQSQMWLGLSDRFNNTDAGGKGE